MSKHIEPHELAARLIKSIIARDFNCTSDDPNYNFYVGKFTEIVSRMHANNEERIRETFHDMVKANKLYALQEDYEKENVIFWMLVYTFGNGYDLEYYSDGVLINARVEY